MFPDNDSWVEHSSEGVRSVRRVGEAQRIAAGGDAAQSNRMRTDSDPDLVEIDFRRCSRMGLGRIVRR